MKKFLSCVLAVMMVVSVAVDAKSRSYRSSAPSKPSYTTNRSAPVAKTSRSYEAPKAAAPSNNSLRNLGFAKPASQPAAKTQTVNASSKATSWFKPKAAPVKTVSKPTLQIRKVSAPTQYKAKRTVNVQRNYYGGGYGYNRGGGSYYSGGYRPYGGYGGSSMADSFIGTMGGMMMYNALFNSHHNTGYSSGATSAQIEEAKQDQRIEDKLDRLIDEQDKPDYNYQPSPAPATLPVAQAPCYLPEDAPLMMDPKFYCQPQK